MAGRKNSLPSFQIITDGDLSQSTVTSAVINIEYLDNIGVQINISGGAANGVLAPQVSIDHKEDTEGNVLVAGNWVTVASMQVAISAGAPTPIYMDLNQLSAPYVRLQYTKTSGTGTMQAFVTAKML